MSQSMTLAEVCEAIVDCEHKTAPVDVEGGFFAVGTPAMRGNRISYSAARRISGETFEAWTRRLMPQFGDLLLAREAPVGPVVRMPKAANVAPGQRTVLLRPNPSLIDADYLYYLLISPTQQSRLLQKAEGSTVPHLNVADVRSYELPSLPPIAEQRVIAATLCLLDDKIESNRRAIELLQHVSAAVFRQWKRESETAKSSTFGDYADVYGGATPKTTVPENWGGNLAWTTPTDVTGLSAPYLFETSRNITDEGLRSCTAVMHPAGTIFMTSRATIGAFAINQIEAATNQGFIAVRPKRDTDRFFLLEEMRSRVDEFLDNANGSTFLEISRGRFKELPLPVPGSEALGQLDARIRPLHAKAAQLSKECARLAKIRDSLLPELLSGRIRVPVEGVEA